MDGGVTAALVAAVGLLVTQFLLHRRWTREQDLKRAEAAAKAAEDRKAEAKELADERRSEQREILERMAEQNSAVVQNALLVAEIHKEDAERARLQALEAANAHGECRQEVAVLGGRFEELRARMAETERTSGREVLVSQRHQDLKHRTLTALTASEATTSLVVKCADSCTCHAFDPIQTLLDGYRPRLDELLEENRMSLEEWAANHHKERTQ